MVGDSCRRLRKLDVSELCGGFTDQGLAAMAPNLGALEVLRASNCDAVTDVSLVALARHCLRLKDVDVSFCEVGDEGITALALQHIGPDDLFALDKRGRLEGGPLMWLATKCPNLQVFEAQRASGLAVSEGTLLAQHWWTLPVADAVVTHLATHCRRIHTLSLLGCKGVSDAGLRAVAVNCGGELRYLDVSGCHLITDASVSAIAAGCQQLDT
eukprot:jgi/Mesvir1/594/Mv02035-RA.1